MTLPRTQPKTVDGRFPSADSLFLAVLGAGEKLDGVAACAVVEPFGLQAAWKASPDGRLGLSTMHGRLDTGELPRPGYGHG